MQRYSDSLLLKNVIFALTRRTADFPSTLADHGYTQVFIEGAVTTLGATVSYDMAVVTPARNRSLLLEMKGGLYANAEAQQRFGNQLSRYAALTPADVIRHGFSVAPPNNPALHQLQVGIVGMAGQLQHVEAILDQHPAQFPMLGVRLHRFASGDTPEFAGITVDKVPLSDADLHAALGSMARTYPIPLRFLPFDSDSKAYDIVAAFMPHLVQLLISSPQGVRFHISGLIKTIILPWDDLGSEEQQKYVKRVDALLRENIPAGKFTQVLTRSSPFVWEFDPQHGRSARMGKFPDYVMRMAAEFAARFSPPTELQMPFSEVDE